MTTNYPNSLDDTTILRNNYTDSTATLDEHASIHNNLADAILAIENELGVNPSGSFSTVVQRLANLVYKTPTETQIIKPSGDYVALALKAHASQSANMIEARASNNSLLGSIDASGVVDAVSYQVGGSTLASTHLSDSSTIAKNPSPSITTPTISNANMTGSPVAPTPSTSDNSTKIATTAYVIAQQYAKLASPSFTGIPVAPTANVDTNTTQIATTEFVINQIQATPAPSVDTGVIVAYAGSTAPSGWLLCDGSAVSQTTYANLYAVIGLNYGDPGGGNFNLPDFRGRTVVGLGTHASVDSFADNDGGAVGSRRPKHTHSSSLSGASGGGHSHNVSIGSAGGHTHNITGASSVGRLGGGATYAAPANMTTSSAGDHTHSLSSIGSAGAHSHTSASGTIGQSGLTDTPAFLVLNYIIKT